MQHLLDDAEKLGAKHVKAADIKLLGSLRFMLDSDEQKRVQAIVEALESNGAIPPAVRLWKP